MRKRTVTTIEMHQIVIARRPASAGRAWCPACLKEVEMASLEEEALLAGVSLRDICRRIGADHVHLVETAGGALVCTNSLLKRDLPSPEDGKVLAMATASASSRQVSGKNRLAAIISQRVAARSSSPADVLSQFGAVFRIKE